MNLEEVMLGSFSICTMVCLRISGLHNQLLNHISFFTPLLEGGKLSCFSRLQPSLAPWFPHATCFCHFCRRGEIAAIVPHFRWSLPMPRR